MHESTFENNTKRGGVMGLLRRFRSNKDGIAAVEFAMIVPILLAMYLGTIEISTGITVNKRVARVSSTVADLVTQQSTVTKGTLDDILEIGAAIMQPYTADKPKITVIGVDVNSTYPQGGKVSWSRVYDKGTFKAGAAKNADTIVPANLRIDGTFVVMVQTDIEYRPVVTWVIGSKTDNSGNSYTALDMMERYFLRPRLSATVDCSDC